MRGKSTCTLVQHSFHTTNECERALHFQRALHEKSLCIYKPGPVSTLRWTSIIYLADTLPCRSSDLPSGTLLLQGDGLSLLLHFEASGIHGLSARGVYQATPLTRHAGELLPHLFILTIPITQDSAVSLSAALSVEGPFPTLPLPVRKHVTLSCPDFPPRPEGPERWSDAQDVKEHVHTLIACDG